MLDLGLGLKYPSPVGAGTPWTPADITDLTVFLHFAAGNCFESNDNTVSTAGNPVGYVAPLFGTAINAGSLVLKPTFREDGLKFDSAGAQQLLPSADIVLSGTGSTVYTVQIATSGQICPILNSIAGQAFVSGDGSGVIFQSDGTQSSAMAMTQDSLSVFRMDIDASGDATIDATGAVQNQLPAAGAFTFDLIAGTGANLANDSAANRYVLIIAVARRIVLGSAEDLLIRGWITTNTGASL